ncbi:LysR family transcriptional regulator [Acidaminococcus massiliensis]|uniref:LysR family transcriptional regulator n=1 Tax=Acidaminococcus massiliensis TaxID=1852375 RepID=UPI0026DB900F|nr:LysR family transcriptional regulator [Acidaminococcus massiliensis]
MSIKDELYVCTLAKCGTILEASKKLYISPPALSMYIHHLEDNLGVQLFYRENQRFKPTVIGWQYIKRSQKILEIDQEFRAELIDFKKKKKGEISLGLYRRRGISFMLPLLARLKEELPDISVKITVGSSSELKQMLAEGVLDFILVTAAKKGFAKNNCIIDDQLVLAYPSTWLVSGRHPFSPEKKHGSLAQLTAQKILLPGVQQSIYFFVNRYLTENQIDTSRLATLNNMEIAMQNVSAGIACCFTLKSYIESFAHIPQITFLPLPDISFKIPWILEYKENPLSQKHFKILKNTLKYMIQDRL